MTPKEKAEELFNKLNDKIISFEDVRLRGNGYEMTKQCALIAVDEIQKLYEQEFIRGGNFWDEVKKELQK